MTNETIVMTKRDGPEIARIAKIIRDACLEEDPETVYMACLAICMLLVHPEIDTPAMQKGIQGASEWINMYCEGNIETKNGGLPANKVN